MNLFDGLWKYASNRERKSSLTEFDYFELSHLVQGSGEWRTWRRGVIGASDAAVIMKENPWKSPTVLIEEKLGLRSEFEGNSVTREGNALEEVARKLVQKKFNMSLNPSVVQDGQIPYLAASIDAIDENHEFVFEIKCGKKAYEILMEQKKVPQYYVGQLQHIMMVTQLDKITYIGYRPNAKLITLEVERDDGYISMLRKAETQFAESLIRRGHQLQTRYLGRAIHRQ